MSEDMGRNCIPRRH